MREVITSAQNPKIKKLVALQQKSSERRESGLFIVEGVREIQHCIDAGFEIDSIFWCSLGGASFHGASPLTDLRFAHPSQADAWAPPVHEATGGHGSSGMSAGSASPAPKLFEVSEEVYRKVAYREGTEGIIAEVRCREMGLKDLVLGERPLVVVLESVEKPGNLGAVLRSADAAGVTAVLVCDPLTDIYNPNLIRASLGGIFTVPCVACTSSEAIAFLKSHGVQILTAQLQDSSWYYDCNMTGGTAIVIGTEATGLTQVWREAADAHIKIPMLGALDSLNASVSAAILMFEAVRQRNGREAEKRRGSI